MHIRNKMICELLKESEVAINPLPFICTAFSNLRGAQNECHLWNMQTFWRTHSSSRDLFNFQRTQLRNVYFDTINWWLDDLPAQLKCCRNLINFLPSFKQKFKQVLRSAHKISSNDTNAHKNVLQNVTWFYLLLYRFYYYWSSPINVEKRQKSCASFDIYHKINEIQT